jgi:2-pyrone-4,6-dicarboxylate lactonase
MTATLEPRMPRAPHWTLPDGACACDCHAHVFGPYDRFPLAHKKHYEAPLAPAALHREMLDRTGLSRGVLIHPGAYGGDPAAVVDALSQANGKLQEKDPGRRACPRSFPRLGTG